MPLPYDVEIQLRRMLNDFGTCPGEEGLTYQQDPFVGDGSSKNFTLLNVPSSLFQVFVYLSGVLQQDPEQMTISSQTVTFVTAPGAGAAVLCVYVH